jgi:hypothetical protein
MVSMTQLYLKKTYDIQRVGKTYRRNFIRFTTPKSGAGATSLRGNMSSASRSSYVTGTESFRNVDKGWFDLEDGRSAFAFTSAVSECDLEEMAAKDLFCRQEHGEAAEQDKEAQEDVEGTILSPSRVRRRCSVSVMIMSTTSRK